MWWQAALFAIGLGLVTLWAWNQARVDARRSVAVLAARLAQQDESWDHRHETRTPVPTYSPLPLTTSAIVHHRKRPSHGRWIAATMLVLAYAGGVVGSFQFFTKRFGCSVFPNSEAPSCGMVVAFNAALWPFDLGKEAARWAFEREGARPARSN
ncbi:hypothetical protein ACVWZZ_003437 [Bradyrhizobium sp. LM6.10]